MSINTISIYGNIISIPNKLLGMTMLNQSVDVNWLGHRSWRPGECWPCWNVWCSSPWRWWRGTCCLRRVEAIRLGVNGDFRILWHGGTLVPYFWPYFVGYSLKFRPYMGLIYGRYLQFRFLKWPSDWGMSHQTSTILWMLQVWNIYLHFGFFWGIDHH